MTQIQKFILWSSVTLSVALLLVIGIYIFLQYSFFILPEENSLESQVQESSQESTEKEAAVDTGASIEVQEDIPLKDLPISEQQLKTLDSFGVDVDTFVITPAMIMCAEEKLGAARVQEITDGASINFTETIKLAPCLH